MSRKSDQKIKILYVAEFLLEYSSEKTPVKAPDIIAYLAGKGISAERKSIYDDIACLERFGFDIGRKAGPDGGYYAAPRPLAAEDVKILADAVSVSRFLSKRKTRDLKEKLAALLPRPERGLLRESVHVMSRQNHPPENIYQTLDIIRRALAKKKSIEFYYTEWFVSKENGRLSYSQRLRHGGKRYYVHPLAVLWDDVNYYLVAYENASDMIRHYRPDRMEKPEISERPNPEGKKAALRFDPAVYSPAVFDMFSGEERRVIFSFSEEVLGAVIDRFGEDIIIEEGGEAGVYRTIQTVRISPRFFAWVLAFGDKLCIAGPEDVLDEMKDFLREAAGQYKIREQ